MYNTKRSNYESIKTNIKNQLVKPNDYEDRMYQGVVEKAIKEQFQATLLDKWFPTRIDRKKYTKRYFKETKVPFTISPSALCVQNGYSE